MLLSDNSSNASVSVSNKKMEKNGASEVNVNSPDSSNTKELITSSKSECDTKARGDGVHVVNGEVTATDDSCDAPNNVTSSSNSVQENGDVSRKGNITFHLFLVLNRNCNLCVFNFKYISLK